VVQRALDAAVRVEGSVVGSFTGSGLVVLLGVTHSDTVKSAQRMADKIRGLRIFEHRHAPDDMCLPPGTGREVSASDLGLPVLLISQFTLYADTRKGRRPTWEAAAPGEIAEPLVQVTVDALRAAGTHVATGIFGADMQVSLTGDGPMTLIIEVDD
jgi:D-tyrosyl-tRNA(Tyr) deacylase